MAAALLTARNPVAADFEALPLLGPDAFASALSGRLAAGGRLVALFGVPREGGPEAVAAVARDEEGELDLREKARRKALRLLETHEPAPLPADLAARIDAIVAGFVPGESGGARG